MAEKKKRILIAEDEKPMAHALELKLTKAGFEPVVVHDGQAALDAVHAQEFSFILLDLMMPKLDGFAVLEELKKSGNATKVIVTSNLGQEEDAKRAKALGALEYFIKSDTPITQLVEYIQQHA